MEQKGKEGFFSLKNRYIAYMMVLAGGIMADIGVLLINSERRSLSVMLMAFGALILFYSLYLITQDKFNISRSNMRMIK